MESAIGSDLNSFPPHGPGLSNLPYSRAWLVLFAGVFIVA